MVEEVLTLWKYVSENKVSSFVELPYFEGDWLQASLKDIFNSRGNRKSKRGGSRKRKSPSKQLNEWDLSKKIFDRMELNKEDLFVVRFKPLKVDSKLLPPITDADMLRNTMLRNNKFDGRERFLDCCLEMELEFSSLERASFSSQVLVNELLRDGFISNCLKCNAEVNFRVESELLYLCDDCRRRKNQPRNRARLGFDSDDSRSGGPTACAGSASVVNDERVQQIQTTQPQMPLSHVPTCSHLMEKPFQRQQNQDWTFCDQKQDTSFQYLPDAFVLPLDQKERITVSDVRQLVRVQQQTPHKPMIAGGAEHSLRNASLTESSSTTAAAPMPSAARTFSPPPLFHRNTLGTTDGSAVTALPSCSSHTENAPLASYAFPGSRVQHGDAALVSAESTLPSQLRCQDGPANRIKPNFNQQSSIANNDVVALLANPLQLDFQSSEGALVACLRDQSLTAQQQQIPGERLESMDISPIEDDTH